MIEPKPWPKASLRSMPPYDAACYTCVGSGYKASVTLGILKSIHPVLCPECRGTRVAALPWSEIGLDKNVGRRIL